MIDHRNRIAELMRLQDTGQRRRRRTATRSSEAIPRQIALLWQTRPLRRDRLLVADEVEIALLICPASPTRPARLYARWERVARRARPSFLRLGSWIGGDRDGNPIVTAESLQARARPSGGDGARIVTCAAPRARYGAVDLDELATVARREVLALPEAATRASRRSRRTLSARAHQHLCAASGDLRDVHGASAGAARGTVSGAPYAALEEFRADLDTLARSLAADGSGLLATGGPLDVLIRAVECCGFHLATLDLRQNSDVHARVVAELLRVAGAHADYSSLDEDARVAVLRRELAAPRPLCVPLKPMRTRLERSSRSSVPRKPRMNGTATSASRLTSFRSARAFPTCSR